MKEIPLSKGAVAIVDDDTYEELSKYKWCINNNGYAVRATPGRRDEKRPLIMMHRSIMVLNHGDARDVDHIDGNKLNNQRSNLRICTRAENLRNRKKNSNNSSGYKGVCWHKAMGKWHARIMHDYHYHDLGFFADAEMAHAAYCKAADSLHGEFSCHG
jgi:hypothetical protein